MIINPFLLSQVVSDWTPSSLSNLFAWYRADDFTEDGGEINQLTDKSGNGRHLIQTDPDYRPLASPTGGPNSMPAIDFTDGVSLLYCDAVDFDGPLITPFTVIGVYQCPAIFINTFIDENEDDPPLFNVGFYSTFFLGDGTTNLYYGSNFTDWHFHEWEVSGSTPTIRLDGNVESYSGTISSEVQTHTIRVGEVRPGIGNYGLSGKVSEIILINGTMSSGERANLESYFSSRYSL